MIEKIFSPETLNVLRELTLYFWCLPLLAGLFNWNHKTNSQKDLFFVVLIMFGNETIARLLFLAKQYNLWLFHIYVPILFWYVFRFYITQIHFLKNRPLTRWIPYLFLGICLVESLLLKSFLVINSLAIQLASIMYVILAISYFLDVLNHGRNTSLVKYPVFWLSIGGLIYYSSTFLLFAFYEKFIANVNLYTIGWTINGVLYLLLIVFFTIGLIQKPAAD